MVGAYPAVEGQHRRDILWHTVVGPRGIVILYDLQRRLGLGRQLEWINGNDKSSVAEWGIGMRLGTHNDNERSDGEVCIDRGFFENDLEWSVLHGARVRPVLATLDSRAFNQVRYHDNGRGTHLPN